MERVIKPTQEISTTRLAILLEGAAVLQQIQGLINHGVDGKELADAVKEIIREMQK